MTSETLRFIDELVEIVPELAEMHSEFFAEWGWVDPPITVLFGSFGSEIAKLEKAAGLPSQVFEFIDKGLETQDQSLCVNIATGLLEALYNKAHSIHCWSQIVPRLGSRSKKYIDRKAKVTSETLKFVDALVEIMPELAEMRSEFFEEWGWMDPPITVLFGSFGCEIAMMGKAADLRPQVFEFIDKGLEIPDQSLHDAIATGLLEALYNKSHIIGCWSQILPRLGVRSQRYIDAWVDFGDTGIINPTTS